MTLPLLSLEIGSEHDVVFARQRARQIAALLGFEAQDQSRIATAVSEIARNAFQYASGGRVEFSIAQNLAPSLGVRVADRGPGIRDVQRIFDGQYVSATGMGLGIVGARRLMDELEIRSSPSDGTTVTMSKRLPRGASMPNHATVARISETLAREGPSGVVGEVHRQNREILTGLEELTARYREIERLNAELEETNRGVVALYSELDEKAALLERANSLKTTFLSDFSHEVRTPLNAVRNLARLLLDGYEGQLSDTQRHAVALIRSSTDSLAELVDDWLDLAKIEAGKIIVRTTEFELASLFAVLRGVFRPLATSPDVTLTIVDPQGIGTLNTDDAKVSQILRNLISNALKFTTRGEVRVSAALGADHTIIVTVTDTGIGIAGADLERIFEEFSQVENAIQAHLKGTGLGLPISRKLARLLRGNLTVRSTPGTGTTFTLIIPRVYRDPTLGHADGELIANAATAS
jgi:signal transduction histidine kinase